VATVFRRPWRSAVLVRAGAVRTAALAAAAAAGCPVQGTEVQDGDTPRSRQAALVARRVLACAAEAKAYAEAPTNPLRALTGSLVEGAWANVHAADEHLLDLVPDDEVRGYAPVAAYEVRRLLRATDPRRVAVEARARALAGGGRVTGADRAVLASALRGVHYANAARYVRVRSLRNTQLGFAVVFFLVALALGWLGAEHRDAFSVCVGSVCPSGRTTPGWGEVWLVELVGMLGGAVAAARAVTGTTLPSGRYSVVIAQALLKTMLGAVTAVLGIWFLRAGAVPGVDSVDEQAEILLWAAVFGYAQQLLTGLIDQRAAAAAQEPAAEATEAEQ
jgi:hypothetical protein